MKNMHFSTGRDVSFMRNYWGFEQIYLIRLVFTHDGNYK
jgi:hypothetical protein